MSGRRSYSDDEFVAAAKASISVAETLRRLGLVPKGGNYRTVRADVSRLKLDVSHWLGLAHLRGKTRRLPRLPLCDILVDGSEYSRTHMKKRILQEGLLKNECILCGQIPEWKGKPLVLILDHINGKNNDNRLENLRILCPHCNSQQGTFCGRRNKGTKKINREWRCEDCGHAVSRDARWCRSCGTKRTRKVDRPSMELLLQDVAAMSKEAIGRKYGVTGNAIRKWLRQAR